MRFIPERRDLEGDAWAEIRREIEALCNIHGDAIAEFEKCREFGGRLSMLLQKVEGAGSIRIADRVMDVMSSCSPKVGTHCENSLRTKGMLERLRDRIIEEMDNKG